MIDLIPSSFIYKSLTPCLEQASGNSAGNGNAEAIGRDQRELQELSLCL